MAKKTNRKLAPKRQRTKKANKKRVKEAIGIQAAKKYDDPSQQLFRNQKLRNEAEDVNQAAARIVREATDKK